MTVAWEAVITGLISLGVALVLGFVSVRAYQRTRNAGFLFIALALVIVPQVSGLVDRSIFLWFVDRMGDGLSLSESLRLYHVVRLSLTALLLSAGLVMLSRRRAVPSTEEADS